MAVEFEGGVVIGADTRTTLGSYIANRVTDKLTPIHDRIYCCRSGSAADTQAIADIVRYYTQMYAVQHDEPPTVRTVAALFQEICYQNKDNMSAGIIVAGWDKYNGGTIYTIPLGGSLHKQPFTVGGSGSSYIYGYCDSNFKKNMTKEEAVAFVKNAVTLALSRDGSSGGCVRIAIINEEGAEKFFFPGNELPEYRKPIIYNALVIKELAKEVYIKEGLRPPTISEISQAWSNLKSIRLQEIGLKDAARIAIRSVEVLGFFAIGEIIGRRNL
ncbi:11538_t:CDS:2, partial [Scutellospora calospora]